MFIARKERNLADSRNNIFACLFSVHDMIDFSHYEQEW